jgi:hypothetical protein
VRSGAAAVPLADVVRELAECDVAALNPPDNPTELDLIAAFLIKPSLLSLNTSFGCGSLPSFILAGLISWHFRGDNDDKTSRCHATKGTCVRVFDFGGPNCRRDGRCRYEMPNFHLEDERSSSVNKY